MIKGLLFYNWSFSLSSYAQRSTVSSIIELKQAERLFFCTSGALLFQNLWKNPSHSIIPASKYQRFLHENHESKDPILA